MLTRPYLAPSGSFFDEKMLTRQTITPPNMSRRFLLRLEKMPLALVVYF